MMNSSTQNNTESREPGDNYKRVGKTGCKALDLLFWHFLINVKTLID